MTAQFLEQIGEAARLARAGRLGAALQALRRAAPGTRAAAPFPAPQTPRAEAPMAQSPVAALRDAAAPFRAPLSETLRDLAARARPREAPVARPLPPEPPEGARFLAGRHAGPLGARDYKLYLPAGLGAGAPLVLMLHGCTQDPDDFARGTGMNAAAEERGAILVYPAQDAEANAKLCWNWFRPEDQGTETGETALLAALTREIVAARGADPARVYVAGLSAGGAQAMNLATRFPDLFAAAGVHSGLPAGAARDALTAFAAMRSGAAAPPAERPVRAIVFQGDADKVVNPSNAAAVADQAAAAAGPLTREIETGTAGGRAYRRELRRDAAGRARAETWTVQGAGHAWSGGDPSGSFAESEGPDASREMLRFFLDG